MSNLTINKHRCKLKYLCFKTATKPYTANVVATRGRISDCFTERLVLW